MKLKLAKILFWGAQGGGKSKVLERMHRGWIADEYKSTLGADFFTMEYLKDTTTRTLQIWEAGGNQDKSILFFVCRNLDMFVYCVDLSEKINEKEILEDVTYIRNMAPDAKIVLLGTKCDKSLSGNDEQFGKIQFKGIDIAHKMITSAKENIGFESTKTTTGLFDVLVDLVPEEPTVEKAYLIEKENSREEATKVTPPSYHYLWGQARQPAVDQATQDFESAKTLLKDYCKVSYPLSFFEYLRSSLEIAVTGHWFRHHRNAVWDTLKAEPSNVQELLKTLEEKLLEYANPIELGGSLVRRINFIQSHLPEIERPIDVNKLKETIANNNAEQQSTQGKTV